MSDVFPLSETQGCHLIPLFFYFIPSYVFFCLVLFPLCPLTGNGPLSSLFSSRKLFDFFSMALVELLVCL